MELHSVQAAQKLTRELAERSKPGFSGEENLQYKGYQAFQGAQADVRQLVEGELFERMGKLVLRKDQLLADELARSRLGLP
jgi:hypothetical protein